MEFNFGSGTGWYFTAGGMRTFTWTKGGPQDPMSLLDESGSPLLVQPGKSYVGFVPAARANAVSWNAA